MVSGCHSIHINRKPSADKSGGKLTPSFVFEQLGGTPTFISRGKKQLKINGNEYWCRYDGGGLEGNNMSEICYS